MTSPPLVSVITNCFNDARYLRANVASVLSQRHENFEHIVIDCGSTDGSRDVLAEIAHPRLRVIAVPHCGLSSGRNQAVAAAQGEFIAILDADDVALPERLTSALALFSADPDVVVTGGVMERYDEATGRVSQVKHPGTHRGLVTLLEAGTNSVMNSTATFRRDALLRVGGYDESFRHAEDYDLLLRMRHLGKFAAARIPVARVTFRQGSHSEKARTESRDVLHYAALALLLDAAGSRTEEVRSALDQALLRIGRDSLRALRARWALCALLNGGIPDPLVARYLVPMVRFLAGTNHGLHTPKATAALWAGAVS